jgi:tricorn protease-like protein
VGFTSDNQTVISQTEHGLRLWDISTGATDDISSPGLSFFRELVNPTRNIAVHSREGIAALGKTNGVVEIWGVPSRKLETAWTAHSGAIGAIAISPDGSQVATASWDKRVAVWNVAGNVAPSEPVARFGPLPAGITCLIFSPDGRRLLASGHGETIWVFDIEQGQEQASLRSPGGDASDLAFAPDGALIAAVALQSASVNLLDVRSGKVLDVLSGPVQAIVSMAFSSDGRTLAAGIDTRGVILWNLDTRQQLMHLPFDGLFDSLCFSADGRTLAVGSAKGAQRQIRLFYAPTLSEIESRKAN